MTTKEKNNYKDRAFDFGKTKISNRLERDLSEEIYSDYITKGVFDHRKYLEIKRECYFSAIESVETYPLIKLIALKQYLKDLTLSTDNKGVLLSLKTYSRHINHLMNINMLGAFHIEKGMYKRVMSYGYLHHNKVGRIYASITSLPSFPREIRSLLFQDYYINVDLVNAHFSILHNFAEKNFLSSDTLKQYLTDRQKILEYLCMELKLKDIGNAKKQITQLINLKNYKGSNVFLKKLFEEISLIREKIYESFFLERPDFGLECLNSEKFQAKTLEEKKVTLQVIYCQTRESEILLELRDFLVEKIKRKEQSWLEDTDMVEKKNGLECIPFNGGAYIKFEDNKIQESIPSLISEFNDKLPLYINFMIKEIKFDSVRLDERIFKRYVNICEFLAGIEQGVYNTLIKKLEVPPLILDRALVLDIKKGHDDNLITVANLKKAEAKKKKSEEKKKKARNETIKEKQPLTETEKQALTEKISSMVYLTFDERTKLEKAADLFRYNIYSKLLPHSETLEELKNLLEKRS
jgi:hypothetical protein